MSRVRNQSIATSKDGWLISQDLLNQIQASQIAAASRGRNVIETPSFVVLLNEQSDLPWFNYAIPISEDFSEIAIEQMIDAFVLAKRTPRLEYLPELWPGLSVALLRRGFSVQAQLPLMVCTGQTYRAPGVSGIEVRLLTPADDFLPYLTVGSEAFGEVPVAIDERAQRHKTQVEQGVLRCAVAYSKGQAVSVACTMPALGAAELAGVATKVEFRRKGYGSAVSAFLIEHEFSRTPEIVIWLSAGDDSAKAVYEGLGFQSVGEQHSYWLE